MTWSDVKKTLTTPPPSRPPPPKYPLFTKDFFSTRSFGPGHLVGAAVLGLGLYAAIKYSIDRGRAEQQARQGAPRRPEDDPQLAQTANVRGQYGWT